MSVGSHTYAVRRNNEGGDRHDSQIKSSRPAASSAALTITVLISYSSYPLIHESALQRIHSVIQTDFNIPQGEWNTRQFYEPVWTEEILVYTVPSVLFLPILANQFQRQGSILYKCETKFRVLVDIFSGIHDNTALNLKKAIHCL